MIFVRPPAAAGRFYDVDAAKLNKQLDAAFRIASQKKEGTKAKPEKFHAAVVPHAGYEYSGWVAAGFYSLLNENSPKNYIIIGPNHYLYGSKFAIMKSGLWKTPLGGAVIHEGMAEDLLKECKFLDNDVIPHQNEHSVEVQLPFLQRALGENFKFVPISISNEAPSDDLLKECQNLGEAITGIVKKSEDKWAVLASSDFSHYVPQEVANDVDSALIKSIVKLNEKQLFSQIAELNATACGFGPIATAMVAAKRLGSKKGKLLMHGTSGDVTGDLNSVVGYASIIL
jgi:MEMO1 family protein